jgi:hypothetical protein
MRRVLNQYKFAAVCAAVNENNNKYSAVHGMERVDVHSDIVYEHENLFMIYEKKNKNVCVFNIGEESPENIRIIFLFAYKLIKLYHIETVIISSVDDKWAILRKMLYGCIVDNVNGVVFTTINLYSNMNKLKELSECAKK